MRISCCPMGARRKRAKTAMRTLCRFLEGAVELNRRMLWSEGLGHNKFVVFAKTPSDPLMVWTGSTNWATTGLCTQLNNGILARDAGLASIYLKQWKLLKDDHRTGRGGAAMHFGEALMKSNDQVKSGSGGAMGNWNAWFTRTSEGQDMAAVTDLINKAQEAVLFLMFEPGSSGLSRSIERGGRPPEGPRNEKLYAPRGGKHSCKPPGARGQEVGCGA